MCLLPSRTSTMDMQVSGVSWWRASSHGHVSLETRFGPMLRVLISCLPFLPNLSESLEALERLGQKPNYTHSQAPVMSCLVLHRAVPSRYAQNWNSGQGTSAAGQVRPHHALAVNAEETRTSPATAFFQMCSGAAEQTMVGEDA